MNPHAHYDSDGVIDLLNLDDNFDYRMQEIQATVVGTDADGWPLIEIADHGVITPHVVPKREFTKGETVRLLTGRSQTTEDGNYYEVIE